MFDALMQFKFNFFSMFVVLMLCMILTVVSFEIPVKCRIFSTGIFFNCFFFLFFCVILVIVPVIF